MTYDGVSRHVRQLDAPLPLHVEVWTSRFRISPVLLLLRLQLYAAFVVPLLTDHTGTRGLKHAEFPLLDAHHRRLRCQIIGIYWPDRSSNELPVVPMLCHKRNRRNSKLMLKWARTSHAVRGTDQRAIDN